MRVPYYHLSEAAGVLTQFPRLSVVINHCGLPLDRSREGLKIWRTGMEALAALPNTTVKVSELGLAHNRWDRPSIEQVVRETLNIFGAKRSMFASNLPVATLTAPDFTEVMDTVLAGATGLGPAELDDLFHATAARVYRIDLAATEEMALESTARECEAPVPPVVQQVPSSPGSSKTGNSKTGFSRAGISGMELSGEVMAR